jgi:hypothetical protein
MPVHPSNLQEAIRNACIEIGLEFPSGGVAKEEPLADGGVPFLAAALRGQPAWRIEFNDLSSASANPRLGRLPYVRDLTVWLAPTTGHVLKALSSWPKGVPPIAPIPSLAAEEYQTAGVGERYTGLPEERPAISLFRTMKVIEVSGPGASAQAKQIVAYYLKRETRRMPERTCWIVHVRGIPPFEAAAPGVPEDARNHFRHVVDAKTAEWLDASTVPQPTEPRPRS